jgi:PadR family transcriptional regulator PadR
LERLAGEEEGPGADPGLLYRTLRQMEREGWVRSTWDTGGSGPARRLYEVTEEGVELLHAWAGRIRRLQRQLAEFLEAYQAHFAAKER